ncbi:alpha/beta fold hydrolase [Microvirga brassicacearum]|uniref:Alpha/beta hydrolase n=1 Tax=Microvirga brassicacearum TaxID=2580413 RepID=A0A5N3P7B9_9HYPH|nr:alpha/beta hydrolase [Microvirga brassicacearum]KAB0265624.1 alpha/beta hydrolase [Microvirga brassicacearum]
MSDDLFAGFESHWVDTEVGRIFARSRGDGPPLVLLHGFPQTHVMWHRLAPTLAETYRVVCMDLRGYGWSSAPKGDAAHETYSKRAMARDVVTVMEELGAVHFAVAGHDRGARVGYRLALDHPGRVERLALLDILPTSYVWAQMKAGKVPAAHWAYLSEPFPKPEEEIGRNPIPYFEGLMKTWSAPGDLSAFDPRAMAAYRDGFNEPSRIHAFCEDYRAGATRDIEADEADLAAGKTIRCPTQLIWSDFYLVSGTSGDSIPPLEIWRTFAPGITGIGVSSGHFVAEENPGATLEALQTFLRA